MLGSLLQAVRQDRHPLIHCITNYVTINDCANILLAAGASPIMADAVEEAAAVTARSQGLTLNLGTLHAERIPAMLASGRQANASGIPAVLDPVGAGVSAFRAGAARQLLEAVQFAVIRGNLFRDTGPGRRRQPRLRGGRRGQPDPADPGRLPGTGRAAVPPHRRCGGRHRRDRPCHRRRDGLLHPQTLR